MEESFAVAIEGELKIGFDFVLNFSINREIQGKDWIGLYLEGQPQTEWGSHWYWSSSGVASSNGSNIQWQATYGPWTPGTYEFRYISSVGRPTLTCSTRFKVTPYQGIEIVPEISSHYVQTEQIRVMSFNVWESGTRRPNGIAGILQTIIEHKPHFVGFQELGHAGFLVLKDLLGSEYHCVHSGSSAFWSAGAVFSKFPVFHEFGSEGTNGAGITVNFHGKPLCFYNSHLTAWPYAPYLLAEGKSNEEVNQAIAKTQLHDINTIWDTHLKKIPHPCILVGDHNIPSHIDGGISDPEHHQLRSSPEWKAPADPFAYPVSSFLSERKFVDSYRQVYPVGSDKFKTDPVPGGFTWTVLDNKKEIFDRIDFIYYREGEIKFQAVNAYLVDKLENAPHLVYASDHRAVVVDISCSFVK